MKSIVLIALITLFLSACTTTRKPGGYFEDDGPHKHAKVDVSNIPDAIPRHEPFNLSRSRPYTVLGKKYYPMSETRNYRKLGVASWYGKKFHGRKTALGERYDMYAMTAAHKTLPLPIYVRVRNLANNRTVVVRVNDRGPFLHNRLIDLSYAAAHRLGMLGRGTADVEVTVVLPGFKPVPPAAGVTINKIDDGDPTSAEEITAQTIDKTENKTAIELDTSKFIYLQVGAFSDAKNAERLRKRLEQSNFSPVLIVPIKKNDRPLFRVRIGPLDNVNAGDAIRRRLADLGMVSAHLVNE